MYLIKKWFKILLMEFCYFLIETSSFFFKKRKENLLFSNLKIGILFLKPLGFGDLIMLSPAIKIIEEIFPNSTIYLITHLPKIIDFKKIKWVSERETKREKIDLLISPTLNLHHIRYIFRAKYWLGFFAKPKTQSNFSKEKLEYNPRLDHYLIRGLLVLKILNKEKSFILETQIRNQEVIYPPFVLKEPEFFKNLKDVPYLAIAPFSRWKERQWPIFYFSKVINTLLKKNIIKKIIILGGKENWEKKSLNEFIKSLEEKFVLNLVGKISLPENAFLIKNSFLYLGLDSGPSHFAYFLAKKPIVIFVSVDPLTRLPLVKELLNNIIYFQPENCPNFPCYSGLYRPRFKTCQICALSIKPENVLDKIYSKI